MTLKELCGAIQEYVNKLECELKIELNDLQNKLSDNKLDELSLSQENAKNYHYEEIMRSLSNIVTSIKKLEFHMSQIEWVGGITDKEQLRRFSYVRRQIYAFSQNVSENKTDNVPLTKIEKRRSAAELSIGSLDAWENYMKQKEKAEENLAKADLPKPVVKRKPFNLKKRKKFVSSTFGEFLDEDANSSLYVISEDEARSQDSLNTDSTSYLSVNTLVDDEVLSDISEHNTDFEDTKSLENYFEILDIPENNEDGFNIDSTSDTETNSKSNSNKDSVHNNVSPNYDIKLNTEITDNEKANEKIMANKSREYDKPRIVDVVISKNARWIETEANFEEKHKS
ncbi:uncharacterized protein LOC143194799 isoform X2 [Rhynchophorus ferrugineus]|uniref:uncharacterized protein LOC143194799 isoform X2 n=1 Tax=Rhynchophorus ferrugineus TaxID=354439 RepID=UPI003FCCF979